MLDDFQSMAVTGLELASIHRIRHLSLAAEMMGRVKRAQDRTVLDGLTASFVAIESSVARMPEAVDELELAAIHMSAVAA